MESIYNISKDYSVLFDLISKGFEVIGFVMQERSYGTFKDLVLISKTEYDKVYCEIKNDNKTYLGYGSFKRRVINNKPEFSAFCKTIDLSFILPQTTN